MENTCVKVGPWIERQMDAVAAIGMGMQGSLEEQLTRYLSICLSI